MNEKVRQELVRIGRKISERLLVVGSGGNTSVKVGNIVYLKASGIDFEEAAINDYVGVDIRTGKLVDGKLKPTSELEMHLMCYRKRKDINAVIHTHPPYASAYAMLGRTMQPFNPDFVAFIKTPVPTIKYVVPTGKELAIEVGKAIGKHNGIFMMNHGILTVGINLKEAYYRTLLIEESSKTVLFAKIFGKMRFFTNKQSNQVDNLATEAYRRKKLTS